MALEEKEPDDRVAPEEGDGRPASRVLDQLFLEGYNFDFFQAVRLLEDAFPDAPGVGTTSDLAHERIRLRPHSGLAFPASDVRAADWQADARLARLTVTFMGLYGVAAPLPSYFREGISRETEESEPFRGFLDIFNHRLYAFFYRAWKKYRPALPHPVRGTDLHPRIFESLAGLGTPGLSRPPGVPFYRLVALGGLLASRVRHASGMAQVASDLLDDLPVRVVENVARWVPLRERPRMGARDGGFGLGTSAVIGQRVRDVSGKFRLLVGPMGLKRFRTLLPGGDGAQLLDYAVRLYAPDHLDYDVELQLYASEVPPVRLGGEQQMGRDMWVGRPAGDVVSVVTAYA